MPGIFSKTNRPKRPGAFVNFSSRPSVPVLTSTNGIAAVLFTHTWGPENQVVPMFSFGDFISYFGAGPTNPYTDGYVAVDGAFRGQDLATSKGAGVVLGIRLVATGGAYATNAVNNATVPAITLRGVYKGSRGNALGRTVVPDARDATLDNLVIYDGTVEIERWRYVKTDIQSLADQINAASRWVRTSGAIVTGTALTANSTVTALTGGVDGSALTAADYTTARGLLESQRFSLLACANLVDDTILASFKSWSDNLNSRGKRFLTVVGGALADTVGTRITAGTASNRSATILNSPNFVNLGGFNAVDSRFGVLSSARLAPRAAGVLAALGTTKSLSYARMRGLTLSTDVSVSTVATDTNVLDAIDNGVVVGVQDSDPVAPFRFEAGRTTYVTTTNADVPYSIFSVPKFVRTMGSLETRITEFAEQKVIGQMQVNPGTVDYVVGSVTGIVQDYIDDGSIQDGATVAQDPDPAPQATDDFVALAVNVSWGRGLEQLLTTVINA